MSQTHQGKVDLEKSRRGYEITRQKYIDNPGSSLVTLRATAHLVKDAYMEGRSGRFSFVCDEPPERGGDDQAPTPLDFFLVGAAF